MFYQRETCYKKLLQSRDLKIQIDIAKKQYQGLHKVYEFDETISKIGGTPTDKKIINQV